MKKRIWLPAGALFVVDQSFARKFFPNRSALGGQVRLWRPAGKT